MSNLPFHARDPELQRNLDELKGRTIDTGGKSVRLRFGTGTLVYTASQQSATLTVTHGLGTTPVNVQLTPSSAGLGLFAVDLIDGSKTSTTFQVAGYIVNGGAVTVNESFDWLAIG